MPLHTARIWDWIEVANVWIVREPLMVEGCYNPMVLCPSYYVTLPQDRKALRSIDSLNGLKFDTGKPRKVPVRSDIVFFSHDSRWASGCLYIDSGCRIGANNCVGCNKIEQSARRDGQFVTVQPHNVVFHPAHDRIQMSHVLAWTFAEELDAFTPAARLAFERLNEFPGVEIQRMAAA